MDCSIHLYVNRTWAEQSAANFKLSNDSYVDDNIIEQVYNADCIEAYFSQ
jgi:hypothetical protein